MDLLLRMVCQKRRTQYKPQDAMSLCCLCGREIGKMLFALLLELLLAVVFSKLPFRQKKASCALPDCIIAMPASIATRPPRQLHPAHAGGHGLIYVLPARRQHNRSFGVQPLGSHPALANSPTNKQEIKKDLTNGRYWSIIQVMLIELINTDARRDRAL